MGPREICRLCAKRKPCCKLINLTKDTGRRLHIAAKIAKLRLDTLVDLDASDTLPKTVCLPCCHLLEETSNFVTNVERAQLFLRDTSNTSIKQEFCSEESDLEDDEEETKCKQVQPHNEDTKRALIEMKLEEIPSGSTDAEEPLVVDINMIQFEVRKDLAKTCYNSNIRGHVPSTVPNVSFAKNNWIKLQASKDSIETISDSYSKSNISSQQKEETWKQYKWICSICDTGFDTLTELRSHTLEHNVCSGFKCLDCSRKVKTIKTFLSHVRRHRRMLRFYCHICNVNHGTTTILKKHYTLKHNHSNECNCCGQVFETNSKLKEHANKFAAAKSKSVNRRDFKCTECKRNFTTNSGLIKHLDIHTDRGKNYTCDKCGKAFFTKRALTLHMLLHDPSRPHKCEICGLMFKNVHRMQCHMGKHNGVRPFSCEICDKSFRFNRQLKSHKMIHTDSMPYTCEYCGKAFRFKERLGLHLRQHTGVKPYSCKDCSRDFTNWPNYNKHMKRKHGIDTSKTRRTSEGTFPINRLPIENVYPSVLSETVEHKRTTLRKPNEPGNNTNDKDAQV